MQFDMPLAELRTYEPDVDEPADFDAYWQATLDAEPGDLGVELTPASTVLTHAEVFDMRFTGHGGASIAAWVLVPPGVAPHTPVVLEFVGYNGGRGRPPEWLNWSCAGHPHVVVDSRGQGGTWRTGDTPDPGATGQPGTMGFLTSGLSSPGEHYYTRLFVDAARAVAAARAVGPLTGRPVIATGGSQGGALALAAAHLGGTDAVMADVPFLSDFRRAVGLTDSFPYAEVAQYCKAYPDRVDQAFRTLSYFDMVSHCRRIDVPGLFSVGLVDTITPPSTVFAAFNAFTGAKQIEIYEFNGHEHGGALHFERKVEFARATFPA